MFKSMLITGGAGFIGSHLAQSIVERNCNVTVYDNLNPQVHGENAGFPLCLKRKGIKLIKGDITDKDRLRQTIEGIDLIVHLAAETGVGQSMYAIEKYVNINIYGTAIILDILANTKNAVKKIVLASSRAVYGEGKYECHNCGVVYPPSRSLQQIENKEWQMKCPKCREYVKSLPTDEDSLLSPSSTYAVTKHTQEQLIANFGKSFNMPYVILRYQNVYGPGQSLSNPYTGILSIFSTRIMNGQAPFVFEDGKETRDFVYIDDAVHATILAIENREIEKETFNVGTGGKTAVLDVANLLIKKLASCLKPKIIGKSRIGDIRHCYADLKKIRDVLGYEPKYDIHSGLADFVYWVKSQKQAIDLSGSANRELDRRGLFK